MLKTLLFDIENAPMRVYTWTKYVDGSVIDIDRNWYMLCWAAKWLSKRKVFHDSLPQHTGYKAGAENDFHIVKSLRDMLHEADIAVAHNGIRFDERKFNAKCLEHGLTPPRPYKSVDTLVLARKHFLMSSNRLDDIGRDLGVGRKHKVGGFELWDSCMRGDPKAWDKMVKYNIQDVRLLEAVYLKLNVWGKHPNVDPDSTVETCPRCGSTDLKRDGYYYTQVGKYQQYQCNNCGGWAKDRINLMEKETRATTLSTL